MSYNGKLHPDDQLDNEEWIAALIFDYKYQSSQRSVEEEDAAILGRHILAKVLSEFRPDLIGDKYWDFGDGNVYFWGEEHERGQSSFFGRRP